MAIGAVFREFGEFLDECGRDGREVSLVEITEYSDGNHGSGLMADVEVVLPPSGSDEEQPAIGLSSPRVGPDGTLRFALESVESIVPSEEYGVSIEPTGGSVGPDGSITVSISAAASEGGTGVETRIAGSDDEPSDTGARSDGWTEGDRSGDDGRSRPESDADSDLPPFKNPELLRSVFESHDTFAEMADAIDMDVTAETVRRYMIDYDIHQPNSYEKSPADEETAEDAEREEDGGEEDAVEAGTERSGKDDETVEDSHPQMGAEADQSQQPVVLSDGIGLPDDVSVDDLIDTVKRSNTLYDVTRKLEIERQDALEMLEELDLLDLVVGRLATEGERDIGRSEVVERLRHASATS